MSDRKIPYFASGSGNLLYFSPEIASAQDYYPFGSIMPGRSLASGDYRYGFNGKEQDPETYGVGNIYDYGFRIYNPRVSRFLSVDPLSPQYPWYTPYQFAGNGPVEFIDLDGLEPIRPAAPSARPVIAGRTPLYRSPVIAPPPPRILVPQAQYGHSNYLISDGRSYVVSGRNKIAVTPRKTAEVLESNRLLLGQIKPSEAVIHTRQRAQEISLQGSVSRLAPIAASGSSDDIGRGEWAEPIIDIDPWGNPIGLIWAGTDEPPESLPVYELDADRFPNVAEHVHNAINAGHPDILTKTDPISAKLNRGRAIGNLGNPGLDFYGMIVEEMSWDEYPFASTREGGWGASTKRVSLDENMNQGRDLKSFYQRYNLNPGQRFKVEVINLQE